MVDQAARDHGFDPKESVVIGDKACDVELARRVGATSILVATGYGEEEYSKRTVTPDFFVCDLEAAALLIIRQTAKNSA